MSTTAWVFLSIFVIFIISAVSVFLLVLYNMLVNREEQANEAWAQVLTFSQRKADLVPSLLDVVKGYAGHEHQTLLDVTQARNFAREIVQDMDGLVGVSQEKLSTMDKAFDAFKSGIGKICVLAEQYPDLKANGNYLTIQGQVEETEDKIAMARERYNAYVNSYNASLRLFPWNLMAAGFQFQSKKYFGTKEGSVR